MDEWLLEIDEVSVKFFTYQGVVHALDAVDLQIRTGEILGLVGETGCGKSVLARSILRLIPDPPGRITQGRILFRNEDLLTCSKKRLREIRGNDISMIFQEPMTSLNPVFTVGNQMMEVVRLHQHVDRRTARTICTDMLEQVRMPDPDKVLSRYPHELSGGMRQRVMIAMELSCQPDLLIADEPTTALDVTVQAQVLNILSELTRKSGTSVLFITHDLGVVAQICDRVAVMYAGKIVESAAAAELFSHPKHPYTQGLLQAVPRLDMEKETLAVISGMVPGLIDPPAGCRFVSRCTERLPACEVTTPSWLQPRPRHHVACHLYETSRGR